MKIERENGRTIVIGKRVVLGQIIMGVLNTAATAWDWFNPDNPVPAGLVGYFGQAAVGAAQIYAVNKFGVTSADKG